VVNVRLVSLGFLPFFALGLGLASTGCNVSSPKGTGGVALTPDAGTCDQGEVVLLTDYTSTQIALAAPDGTPLSPSFLSTASTTTSAISFALSGDVAPPTMRPTSGRVVLLDRYGTNVVSWADPATAKVLAQLPVGTGFESNPQDYVEGDGNKAYVSRWGVNGAPGAQKFDEGSDVIVIDTKAPAITASIAMPTTNALPPRPAGMIRVGASIVVVLQNESQDFMTVSDSVIVGIANDAVAWQTPVSGLKGCNRPALSPSGKTMALSCEGQLDMNGNVMNLAESAVVLFDVTTLPPKELRRFAISDQLKNPTQDQVAFASETVVVGKTQTPLGGTTSNQAFALDTTTGKATVLLTAGLDAQGKGKGIVYGDFVCSPGCAGVCLLADADVGKVQRWTIAADGLHLLTALAMDPSVGLPPIGIGSY
jgi:hypothetical protein